MRIRNGFVSNSSSSSFVCYEYESVESALEKLRKIFAFWDENENIHKNLDEYVHTDLEEVDQQWVDENIDYIFDCTEDYSFYADGVEDSRMVEDKPLLLITSASDNTVPYELIGLICHTFKAKHYHCG